MKILSACSWACHLAYFLCWSASNLELYLFGFGIMTKVVLASKYQILLCISGLENWRCHSLLMVWRSGAVSCRHPDAESTPPLLLRVHKVEQLLKYDLAWLLTIV